MTVILSGYFEAFMRDCAEGFMNSLVARGKPFTALPDAIQYCHFLEGGRILADRARNRALWVAATPSDLCGRLADAVVKTPSKPLWEAFANTQGNPSSNVVKGFLLNLGLNDATTKMEAKAGKPGYWASLKTDLDLFIAVRNQCAHTGTSGHAPGTSTIVDYCDLLDNVATLMVAVLEDHVLAL